LARRRRRRRQTRKTNERRPKKEKKRRRRGEGGREKLRNDIGNKSSNNRNQLQFVFGKEFCDSFSRSSRLRPLLVLACFLKLVFARVRLWLGILCVHLWLDTVGGYSSGEQ